MKKPIFLSFLALTLVAFTACTPKDAPVISDGQRTQFGEKVKGTSVETKKFHPRDFGLSTFLVQKNLEALELVKLSLDFETIDSSFFKKIDGENRKSGEKTIQLLQIQKEIEHQTGRNKILTKLNRPFVAEMGLAEKALKLKIVGENLAYTSFLEDRSKNAKHVEDLTIEILENEQDANLLTISLKSKGFFAGAIGAEVSIVPIEFESTLELSKDTLASEEVAINKLTTKAKYKDPTGTKDWSMAIEGSEFTMKTTGKCPEVVGSFKFTAGPTSETMLFSANEVAIGGKWKRTFAACESRPSVDLSFLLNL